jgi:adenylate cyclase
MTTRRESPWFWVGIVALGAGAGVLYKLLFGYGPIWPSVFYGAGIAIVVSAFERGLLLPQLRARIRRLPTLLFVPAAELAYLAMIVLGHTSAGLVVLVMGFADDDRTSAHPILYTLFPSPRVLLYSLCASAILVSLVRVRDLVGAETLGNLLVGRYRRPVAEERIFLFVDLVGSTAYAARNGDLRAQEYLSALFAAMAEPVQRHRGAIDDYVGDMALITWPLARGATEARCVACVFAIFDAIEAEAEIWRRDFGEVPRLRAALHGGSVVTAEVGIDRHKIAYFGDTVNTTARLEGLARTLGAPVVISADLLARLPALPDGLGARALGRHTLRGRDEPIQVAALERCAETPALSEAV